VVPDAVLPRTTADIERPDIGVGRDGMGPLFRAWNATEWEECREKHMNRTGEYDHEGRIRNDTHWRMRNGTHWRMDRNGTEWMNRNGTEWRRDRNGTDDKGERRGGRGRGGRGRGGRGSGGRGRGGDRMRNGPCDKYYEEDEFDFDPEIPDGEDGPISEFPGVIGGEPIVVLVPGLPDSTGQTSGDAVATTAPTEDRLNAATAAGGITFQQANSADTSGAVEGASAEDEKKQESSAFAVTFVGVSSQLVALAATCWFLIMFDF